MAELLLEKSFLGLRHWLALRALDFIFSLSVFGQSKKLEHLLDEKDEKYVQMGYAQGRLSSPFIQMRR